MKADIIGTVIVKLKSGKTIRIEEVQSYNVPSDNGDFVEVIKNGMRMFFNKNSIVYICRAFELGETE